MGFRISGRKLVKYRDNGEEKVIVPQNITEIGLLAFLDTKAVKEIVLPSGLEKIGAGAFFRCSGLEKINIPDSVREIEQNAFMSCVKLEKINLPSGLRKIGGKVFAKSGLKEIEFSQGILNIGENIFEDTPLRKITLNSYIPDGLISRMFSDCRTVIVDYMNLERKYIYTVKNEATYEENLKTYITEIYKQALEFEAGDFKRFVEDTYKYLTSEKLLELIEHARRLEKYEYQMILMDCHTKNFNNSLNL